MPSHEILEILRTIEGVPPERILPNYGLKREVSRHSARNEWVYIPVLWLFKTLKDSLPFKTEHDLLAWWARHIPSLVAEFESRVHNIAVDRDLSIEDAAQELCKQLNEYSHEELVLFIDQN